MTTFQEKLIIKLLKEEVAYHYQGLQNEVLDGERTQASYNEGLNLETALNIATSALNEAYKKGYLDSPQSAPIIEAKHIKFLGNDRIDPLKMVASVEALNEMGWQPA